MRACSTSLIVFYLCLLLAATWLLVKPLTVFAATGSAKCGSGPTVTCNAFRCDCTDNVGCTGYDEDNHVILSQTRDCDPGLY
jgi:hypothetical protein